LDATDLSRVLPQIQSLIEASRQHVVLQRQIDRALFERVALSRDTRALVRLEKQRGPVETVRYEDAFKDPYLLDFLGLKGAYSEKDQESAIITNTPS